VHYLDVNTGEVVDVRADEPPFAAARIAAFRRARSSPTPRIVAHSSLRASVPRRSIASLAPSTTPTRFAPRWPPIAPSSALGTTSRMIARSRS